MHPELIEDWRPVVGWEADYSVSSLGRVRRDTASVRWPAGLIRPAMHPKGYLQVCLRVSPRKHTIRVHILVAAAFLGPRPDGLTINHIDGNKLNNAVSNLEYVTQQRQIRHAFEHGLSRQDGEHNAIHVLTEAEVVWAREQYAALAVTQQELANRFGVDRTTIRDMLHGRNWPNAGGPIVTGDQHWRRGHVRHS
jgi:hypothetical protein